MLNKKRELGYVLSVDSLLSLTLLLGIVLVAFYYLTSIELHSWNTVDVLLAAQSEAAVLEKSGAAENALLQNVSQPIVSVLNASPASYCYGVKVFSPTDMNTPIMSELKTGCVKTYSRLASTSRALVVINGNVVQKYVLHVDAWAK